MSKDNEKETIEPEVTTQDTEQTASNEENKTTDAEQAQEPQTESEEAPKDELTLATEQIASLQAQVAEFDKKYALKCAEFDNYRRRTLNEKAELIKNGAEKAMKDILPIIDDFERGIKAMEESNDAQAVKEGIDLIYDKFIKYLEKNGVKAIECESGCDFNTELQEAVTTFPAPTEELKGKVVEAVEKGYMLNDKVLRHVKVVVGQ